MPGEFVTPHRAAGHCSIKIKERGPKKRLDTLVASGGGDLKGHENRQPPPLPELRRQSFGTRPTDNISQPRLIETGRSGFKPLRAAGEENLRSRPLTNRGTTHLYNPSMTDVKHHRQLTPRRTPSGRARPARAGASPRRQSGVLGFLNRTHCLRTIVQPWHPQPSTLKRGSAPVVARCTTITSSVRPNAGASRSGRSVWGAWPTASHGRVVRSRCAEVRTPARAPGRHR